MSSKFLLHSSKFGITRFGCLIYLLLMNVISGLSQNAKPYFMTFDTQNDFFIARKPTDRYFTNGISLDFWQNDSKYRQSKLAFLEKIFPIISDGDNYIGIGINMNMFTPSRFYDTLPRGDRPYAGWSNIYLGSIGLRKKDGLKFTTKYSFGFLGKLSGQSWIQEYWHKLIGRRFQKGWDYQINSDIALNINFLGEKRIYNPTKYVDLIGFAEINAGTVMNYMGIGSMLRLGWFDNYFDRPTFANGISKVQTFSYFKPQVRALLDNSLLQGGYVNRGSPHTIAQDKLERFIFQLEFGYCLTIQQFNLTFFQQFRTPEFEGAYNMYWGGFNLVYAF